MPLFGMFVSYCNPFIASNWKHLLQEPDNRDILFSCEVLPVLSTVVVCVVVGIVVCYGVCYVAFLSLGVGEGLVVVNGTIAAWLCHR